MVPSPMTTPNLWLSTSQILGWVPPAVFIGWISPSLRKPPDHCELWQEVIWGEPEKK